MTIEQEVLQFKTIEMTLTAENYSQTLTLPASNTDVQPYIKGMVGGYLGYQGATRDKAGPVKQITIVFKA